MWILAFIITAGLSLVSFIKDSDSKIDPIDVSAGNGAADYLTFEKRQHFIFLTDRMP